MAFAALATGFFMRPLGTLKLEDGNWFATATPDVVMRLHRMFPRMARIGHDTLQARDTPEMAADLEWALLRYPMDCPDADALAGKAAAHRAMVERTVELIASPPPTEHFELAIPLRPYQCSAAAVCLEQGHLLVADEIGLGKTATSIGIISAPHAQPAAVVVKTDLPAQWAREIERFMPGTRVNILKDTKEAALPPADVHLVTYSKLASRWGDLAKVCRSVIFDEIQELRRPESDKYQAASSLCAAVNLRCGLSATPVVNYGDEIWNVLNLLAPDALGTRAEFVREWCVAGSRRMVVREPEALGHRLRAMGLMIRRTRADVGRELPRLTKIIQEVPADDGAYNGAVAKADELAHIILSGTFLERGHAAREFDLRLRQATGIAKAPAVAALVRMIVEGGERVLLGGWHRACHDIWQRELGDLGIAFFTGEESAAEKAEAVRRFCGGDAKVLDMSLRAGAGIDGLQQHCSTVVIGELDWTDAILKQLIGRIDRDGQTKPVQAYICVTSLGADPAISEVLGLKRSQATGIVDLGSDHEALRTDAEVDGSRMRKLAEGFLKNRLDGSACDS